MITIYIIVFRYKHDKLARIEFAGHVSLMLLACVYVCTVNHVNIEMFNGITNGSIL